MSSYSQASPYRRPDIGAQYAQYRGGAPPQTQPNYTIGLPGQSYTPPSYSSGPGINDPTLQAGASYSMGGGNSLPPGAIPFDPFNPGNVNRMYAQGYRKKFVNGNWVWLPPAAPGAQQPPAYQVN